jgi:uncharacterized damage-inducible protein DinB
MPPRHLERLVAHLGWADRATCESLVAAGEPHPAVVELYAHVLAAEHVWLSRIEGTTPAVAVWPAFGLEECDRLARENSARLETLVTGLAEADLVREVTYRNSAGDRFTNTLEDILLHVCLHGAYHRGQIARALREGGALARPTDYIAWARGAPAATRNRAPSP